MEPILHHGAPQGCAFGTIVALEWLCRPYRLLRQEFTAQSGPMLQVGGKLLQDCRVILRYLATRRRHLLGYRAGTAEAEQLEKLLDYLHEEFQSGEARMVLACARLDKLLAESEWLDGRKRTVADASLVAIIRWAVAQAGLQLAPFPHLERHVRTLQGDPAVFFADAIETQRPAVSSGRFRGHLSADALPLAA
ncbi:glutathione S-transferase [Pseudoduganella eburnea]|uniref:Glutathione S-transferase n=1 Tax=Massilia eburnea TaxID=1776165 RepID=A0A6L6QPA7_9BURK|nr:glutathione S-transferase [Massilia eburnea]MTW13496.1 glutathione S-transferase [Massilia eburnea]